MPKFCGQMATMRIFIPLLSILLASAGAAVAQSDDFGSQLSAAAVERTKQRVIYDPAYRRIDYPDGDVPADRGVCSDVVVRSLRTLGFDLQELVHLDMKAAFDAYPNHWGMSRTDTNIDHRRVPNLEAYFSRKGFRQTTGRQPDNFKPGDIVAWNLKGDSGWLPHIGVVTDQIARSGRPMVAHNIGAGPKLEDVLFNWKITGHYRLDPDALSVEN